MAPTATSSSSFPVRHRMLLLVLIGLTLFVPFNGLRDMWYADEPDIAEAAKTMYESGDWVTPRRIGVPWVDYPPMIYWTAVSSAHLLGFNEFALRLPGALAAVALVLLTCWAGSRWFDPATGLWAGFTLLTFQQYVQQAVGYRPDVLFGLAITAGFIVYAAGAGDRPRWPLRVAGFALFGLAMLAKGPLGLLLPGLVLTLWHGTRREWRRVLELVPLALVSLAVYLPWFIACARAMGSDNILYELYAQNFARFVAADRGHGKPIPYYLVNIWGDLAPWSLLLPFALWWVHRARSWRDRHVQLLLWWFGAFFVFLSLAATKRQLYLVPAYPAVALMLGIWIAALLRTDESAPKAPSAQPVRIFGFGVAALLGVAGAALMAAGTGLVMVTDPAEPSPDVRLAVQALRAPVATLGAGLLAGGLWIAAAARLRRTHQVLVRTGVVHVLCYLLLLAWLLPAANPIKSSKTQGRWIRQQMGNATHMGLVYNRARYGFRKMGSFGLYADARVELLESPSQVERFFEVHPDSIVLVEHDEVDGIFRDDADAWADRIVRDLWIGNDYYIVIDGP